VPSRTLADFDSKMTSGVEIDWSAVTCSRSIRQSGLKITMSTLNPEALSSDYTEEDIRFFETLAVESIKGMCLFNYLTTSYQRGKGDFHGVGSLLFCPVWMYLFCRRWRYV
jgi:hypothetical protein